MIALQLPGSNPPRCAPKQIILNLRRAQDRVIRDELGPKQKRFVNR